MELRTEIFSQFDKKWALLTAGDKDNFNTMTISWGGLGTLWNNPVATVYVRASRYTHEFMDANEYFSISFYPERYRRTLAELGSKSGRDMDKIAEAGLTPVDSEVITVPGIREFPLTLECRVLYKEEQDASKLPEDIRKQFYSIQTSDHTAFYGEIVAAYIIE